jgi:hypothetical protein
VRRFVTTTERVGNKPPDHASLTMEASERILFVYCQDANLIGRESSLNVHFQIVLGKKEKLPSKGRGEGPW